MTDLDKLTEEILADKETIVQYCILCQERTTFEYVGQQETSSGDRDFFDLYNCTKCHTTRNRI